MKASEIDCLPRRSVVRQRGIALVIVLGFLVLLTVLIVAFFTSVTNEYTSSKTYVAGASTRFLADAAVNVVMGQITEGTNGQVGNTPSRQTWASQPGMIRTYDDKGNDGNAYKLYSAANMVVVPGTTPVQQEMIADVPIGWETKPAVYSDLNAPVTDANQKLRFPIVDGNVKALTVNGNSVLTYDDENGGKGDGKPDIEGFAIDPKGVPNYKAANPISATNNPAAMPTKWLYVLKDGTLVAPDANGDTTATFDDSAKTDPKKRPTTDNPITGRIAFWTDDETCKLNINTAGEGTYYAQPHANTKIDMQATASFMAAPPLYREYNRYPGHPATTCLSVALGQWLGDPSLNASATYGYGKYFTPNAYTSASDNSKYLGFTGTQPPTDPALCGKGLAAYMLLSPRNAIGGSFAGTVNFNTTGTPTTPVSAAVVNDSDRLYASVDELLFRSPQSVDANSRTAFPNAGLTKDVIEKERFFLTASSRAPELTPFNTPKVSLWPQWYTAGDRQKYQGPTQQLLAFCSSFGSPGGNPNSASKKFEYFWEWYSSNAGIKSLDIYTGTSSGSATLDWTGVPRNQDLAKYLCELGKHNIPGYGAAFRSATKYSDRCFSNIVLESLDYIRSSIARADYQSPVSLASSESTGEYFWTAPLMVNSTILPGVSAAAPIKGFGFFPIFTKVALGEGLNGSGVTGARTPFLAFECFTAPWSYPAGQQSMGVTIKGLGNLGIVKNDGSAIPASTPFYVRIERRVDGGAGFYGRNIPIHTYIADFPGYKFATTVDPIKDSSGNVTTPGSVTMGGAQPVQILLQDGTAVQGSPGVPAGVTFQTMNVTFPSVKVLAAPTQATVMTNGWAAGGGAGGNWYNEVDTYNSPSLFVKDHSVIRGMECNASTAAGGDYRILGGTVNATTNLFATNAAYNTASEKQAHSLWVYSRSSTQPYLNASGANPLTSSIAGSLAPIVTGTNPILSSADYGDLTPPFAPQGLKGAKNASNQAGDWDTGTGKFPDGPYLNVGDQIDMANPNAYTPSQDQGGGNSVCFSPNRRIASAIQFGSLPTGVSASPPRPWETLLFCPNPAARSRVGPGADTKNDSEHIGFKNPPDHMFLENFTIPVVEPYAISEPLSTAGKVNLNYQLAPFTYIDRSTALRGVMKSTLITGISGYDVKDKTYKGNAISPSEIRYNINRDATLDGISKYYFNQGKLFKYPSQICDVFLVPQAIPGATYNIKAAKPPTSYDKMLNWWNPSTSNPGDPLGTMCMTGDNLREEPYGRLYPRLTTKSNTYTVHYRVQVLKKRANSPADVWDEKTDSIQAESRGTTMLERYIDPSDPTLDAGWDNDTRNVTLTGKADLSQFYRFRIISNKKFAP